MSAFLALCDALQESERLIAALERRRAELPFVDDVLALHQPRHRDLETSRLRSEQAVDAWRAALARRWECEVAGRRIYKLIVRQLVEHYGSAAVPEIQMLSRGEAEANSSPSELLHDLRRLQAALAMGASSLPFAAQRLAEIEQTCTALEVAIGEAEICEAQRRTAVLDRRMAQEAYRRARAATRRALAAHYGENIASEFAELFD
jgi:hypothetical protein